MSLLSSDIYKFMQFLNLSLDKIKSYYKSQLDLTEWNYLIDNENLSIIQNHMNTKYKSNNDFFTDINTLAMNDTKDLYRTILKIIDILDLNEIKLDNAISKIFLGEPHFNNCGEES